jgi:ribosomal protein L29
MQTALVYNPTLEELKVQVYGNWFTFKPGQYKTMQKEIADFLTIDRANLGFVGLPSFIAEEVPPIDATEEEKAAFKARCDEAIAEARETGRSRRISHLQKIINNLEVSLRKDLEQSNNKIDPLALASKGEVSAYKELAKYKVAAKADEVNKAEEIKKLKEQINGHSNGADA